MEVDSEPSSSQSNVSSSVMASSGTNGSVTVALHPLVIMNISDHWTRIRAQEGKPTQVLGALIGKQEGRSIEVLNSFELVFDIVESDIIVDLQYYNTKEEQFKQVFKDLEFLGWYTTGGTADQKDIKVHKQICVINESPIFLKLNPLSRSAELPIGCYESVIDLVDGEATMLLVELKYTLATEEAERIGVDHVARVASAEYMENSIVAEHLVTQHNAIKMLHSRVKLVLDYVKAVQAGEVPRNHDILREACSLSQRLPVLNSEQFDISFYNQCNDVALMAYLGAITKGCDTINQFVNKFNVLYDRQGMGLRKRGLFF